MPDERESTTTSERTGAELLREAAASLRAVGLNGFVRRIEVCVDPEVALAVADLLEREAAMSEGGSTPPEAVAVARVYLSAPASAGEPRGEPGDGEHCPGCGSLEWPDCPGVRETR